MKVTVFCAVVLVAAVAMTTACPAGKTPICFTHYEDTYTGLADIPHGDWCYNVNTNGCRNKWCAANKDTSACRDLGGGTGVAAVLPNDVVARAIASAASRLGDSGGYGTRTFIGVTNGQEGIVNRRQDATGKKWYVHTDAGWVEPSYANWAYRRGPPEVGTKLKCVYIDGARAWHPVDCKRKVSRPRFACMYRKQCVDPTKRWQTPTVNDD